MTLRKSVNAPPYVSNHTLHTDCNLNTNHDEAKLFIKNFINVYRPTQILSSRTYHPSQSQVAPQGDSNANDAEIYYFKKKKKKSRLN
jgi:hypothetical protein